MARFPWFPSILNYIKQIKDIHLHSDVFICVSLNNIIVYFLEVKFTLAIRCCLADCFVLSFIYSLFFYSHFSSFPGSPVLVVF